MTIEEISLEPKRAMGRPVMLQRWADLTYVHWPYEPDEVQRLLPAGVNVDIFDGHAWVGLVPFVMRRLRLPVGPALPWVSTFVEVNVRTYVVDRTGRRAVWFFSLEVPRAAAVAVARLAYGLPYTWARCRFESDATTYSYSTHRRWPGPHGATMSLIAERLGPIASDEVSPLEAFLTARWGLVAGREGKLVHAPVDHPPWPLYRGRLVRLEQDLVSAAGLGEPAGEPLVHVSPGVDVRIGAPTRIGR